CVLSMMEHPQTHPQDHWSVAADQHRERCFLLGNNEAFQEFGVRGCSKCRSSGGAAQVADDIVPDALALHRPIRDKEAESPNTYSDVSSRKAFIISEQFWRPTQAAVTGSPRRLSDLPKLPTARVYGLMPTEITTKSDGIRDAAMVNRLMGPELQRHLGAVAP